MMRPDFSVVVERLRGIEKVYPITSLIRLICFDEMRHNANKAKWELLRQPAPPYVPNTASPLSSGTPSSMSTMSMNSVNDYDNYDNEPEGSFCNVYHDEEDLTGNDATTDTATTDVDDVSFIHEV